MTRKSFKNFAKAYKSTLCVKNIRLSENNFIGTLYSVVKSNVTLCEKKICRNVIAYLVQISSKSGAIIQNSKLTENDVSSTVYDVYGNSTIELNNVRFIQNNVMRGLLFMTLSCNANIQKDTVTENCVSGPVYYLRRKSTIQLNNVATWNSLMAKLLKMVSSSTAFIQNSIWCLFE